MSSLHEPAGARKALASLLQTQGLHAVLTALAHACRWESHHVAAAGCYALANRLNRAATAIDWIAYQHAHDLAGGEGGGE
jgi:hypothetical protein